MVARLRGRPTPPPPEDLPPESSESSASARSGTSKLLVAVTALSLTGLIAAGGFIWYQSSGQSLSLSGSNATASNAHGAMATTNDTTGPIHNLGPFVVNLGSLNNQNYLRIALSLDFLVRDSAFVGRSERAKEEWIAEFKRELDHVEPMLKDVVVTTLSSRSPATLNSLPGKEELKAELAARFNQHFSEKAVVHQVYFTDFVIQ